MSRTGADGSGPLHRDPEAGEGAAPRSCMTKAESDAVSRVNIPLLTAFYNSKTGTQPQTIIASR